MSSSASLSETTTRIRPEGLFQKEREKKNFRKDRIPIERVLCDVTLFDHPAVVRIMAQWEATFTRSAKVSKGRQRHVVFEVKVKLDSDRHHYVYRRYNDFYNMHITLMRLFPYEAGEQNSPRYLSFAVPCLLLTLACLLPCQKK